MTMSVTSLDDSSRSSRRHHFETTWSSSSSCRSPFKAARAPPSVEVSGPRLWRRWRSSAGPRGPRWRWRQAYVDAQRSRAQPCYDFALNLTPPPPPACHRNPTSTHCLLCLPASYRPQLLLPVRETTIGKINLSLPRSSSPVGLSPRKSSLKRSGSVDGPDQKRGSTGGRNSDAEARRTSLRKGSLDRKGSTQSVEERRRVSFPDNERDYLGEADWDYDRTPIEVDFDSCFSKYVARVLSARRRSALRAEL